MKIDFLSFEIFPTILLVKFPILVGKLIFLYNRKFYHYLEKLSFLKGIFPIVVYDTFF